MFTIIPIFYFKNVNQEKDERGNIEQRKQGYNRQAINSRNIRLAFIYIEGVCSVKYEVKKLSYYSHCSNMKTLLCWLPLTD